MQALERKLDYFSETVHEGLAEKIRTSSAKKELVFRQNAAEKITTATRQNKVLIEARKNELLRLQSREIAIAKVAEMTATIEKQRQLHDRLEVEVIAGLALFTQQPEYIDYLLAQINEMLHTHIFSSIVLTSYDMRFGDIINAQTKLSPVESDYDFIGGFILYNDIRTIKIDHTFKTRLAQVMKQDVLEIPQTQGNALAQSISASGMPAHD